MSRIVMDEATRDPEPAVGKAVYDANAGWCESHCWLLPRPTQPSPSDA